MKTLNIIFFKSYSHEAKSLLEMVQSEITQFLNYLGIDGSIVVQDSKGLLPDGDKQASAFNVLHYALMNDIVIIDASIERIEGLDFGANYECITPAVSSLDNVLVVSRTELPLNFIPCRSNVAPLGLNDPSDGRTVKKAFGDTVPDSFDESKKPHNDLTTYEKHYSNEYIIEWLKYTLKKMHETGRLVRDGFKYIDVTNPSGNLCQQEMEIMRENLDAINREKGNKKKSFVSYRSTYYPKKEEKDNKRNKRYCGKHDIIDLVNKIDEYHNDPEHIEWEAPFLYPSGVLSNELMPEIRRWAFIAMPDRVIREADEFWIFETKHKKNQDGEIEEYGYWDSWWCLGEFITIIRMKFNGQLKDGFKLMIFNPDTDEINEIPYEEIPSMTDDQNRELARYFANGDFLEAGYESMGNMYEMRKKPVWLRWFYFQLLKKLVWPKVIPSEDIKDFKFKYYNDSVKSHVYDEGFMKKRIHVDIKQERGITRKEIFEDKDLIWKFLNVNGYYTDSKKVPPYPGASIVESVSQLTATDKHFYLLWTPRMCKRTGPDGCIIEVVPIYNGK